MIEAGPLALLIVLGGVVGLDGVSFPQAMISRPLVSATIGGAVCGNPAAGLLVGVLLECFALETMPFGASRYPEWGPASLVAGVVAAVPGGDPATSARLIPFAVVVGLGGAMLAGRTLIWLRRINLAVATRRRDAIAAGEASAIVGLQRIGLAVDFLRAAAVTAVFLLVLLPVRDAVGAASGASGALAVAVAGTLAVGVGGGAFWKVVHTTRGYAWWMAAGVIIGLAAVTLR